MLWASSQGSILSLEQNVQVTSKPQMIDEVDRRLIQLEMEKLSLRKETRADALKRVAQIDDEMADLIKKQVMRNVCSWESFLLYNNIKAYPCCNPFGASGITHAGIYHFCSGDGGSIGVSV